MIGLAGPKGWIIMIKRLKKLCKDSGLTFEASTDTLQGRCVVFRE